MPRLSLNLLVLNGEAVVRRCLASVTGVIDELVVVDSGSDDCTREVLVELAEAMKLDHFYYERLAPYSDDFFTDELATWDFGGRFDPELLGPFTGRRMLKDWAKARNLALVNTTADYVLKLDADDELMSPPENLSKACHYLDGVSGMQFVFAPYEIYDGQGNLESLSMQSRLWRRGSHTRWVQPMHEYLRGMWDECCLQVAQGIRVRDWKDSPGEGVRIAHRNLKTMLWHHCHQSTAWSGHKDVIWQFTLANEAATVFPAWSRELLESLLKQASFPSKAMEADCHYHLGRVAEVEGDVERALLAYQEADRVAKQHMAALLGAVALLQRHGRAESDDCVRLQEKVLQVAGAVPGDPLPYNCDLKLLMALREAHCAHSPPTKGTCHG